MARGPGALDSLPPLPAPGRSRRPSSSETADSRARVAPSERDHCQSHAEASAARVARRSSRSRRREKRELTRPRRPYDRSRQLTAWATRSSPEARGRAAARPALPDRRSVERRGLRVDRPTSLARVRSAVAHDASPGSWTRSALTEDRPDRQMLAAPLPVVGGATRSAPVVEVHSAGGPSRRRCPPVRGAIRPGDQAGAVRSCEPDRAAGVAAAVGGRGAAVPPARPRASVRPR